MNYHSRDLRKGRISQENNYYHIRIGTEHRQPVFKDLYKARLLTRILRNSDELGYSQTYTFCIMPDHIHWLFKLKSQNLSKVVGRLKGNYSRLSETKIWQQGYFDHCIRSDESLVNVARYIVANPKRAGIVSSVSEYSHWDAIWL